MHYFKYPNKNKNLNEELKAQYKALNENERHTLRKQRRWRIFATIVILLFSIASFVTAVLLTESIPRPSAWYWLVPYSIGKGLITGIILIICCVLGFILMKPLLEKIDSFRIPSMKKEIFSKACAHLRNYYNLQKPCIVTKCFNATDKKFQNHDVCLFIVGDELRITTDLVSGFLHGERDLGCYAFKKEEITLTKLENGKHLIAELKADNQVFLLGYRAKGFIDKNFINRSGM